MARQEFCINHRDRPAETRCRQCHKPVCKECVKSDADGQFCSFDCSGKFKDFQRRGLPKRKKGSGLLGKLVALIVLAAMVVYVGGKFLKLPILKEIFEKVAP